MVIIKNLFGEDVEWSPKEKNVNEKVVKKSIEIICGVDKNSAHKKAIELIPEKFFWDCSDELSPFGSDEGDMALEEYRNWKNNNPDKDIYECIKWTIESISEKDISEYDEKILNPVIIRKQLKDDDFNDHQYIFTLDISVIATGFGQLIDEGKIDQQVKHLIKLAINRQKIWTKLVTNWNSEHTKTYIKNLEVLERALQES